MPSFTYSRGPIYHTVNPALADRIRSLHRAGVTYVDIARRLGLPRSTVRALVANHKPIKCTTTYPPKGTR